MRTVGYGVSGVSRLNDIGFVGVYSRKVTMDQRFTVPPQSEPCRMWYFPGRFNR